MVVIKNDVGYVVYGDKFVSMDVKRVEGIVAVRYEYGDYTVIQWSEDRFGRRCYRPYGLANSGGNK
jgi:hypothetical protein